MYVGWWTSTTYIADDKTTAAIKYLVGEEKPPLEALGNHQRVIKEARLSRKHKIITDRIDAKMEIVPNMPSDFENWLDKTGFGQHRYIFYSYKKGRKKQDGYCAACHSPVRIEKPRHKKPGICPLCGKEVAYMVTGKSKRVYDSIQTAVFQKIPEGLVVRYIYVSRKYEEFKRPMFSFFEERRDFYENGNYDPYYHGKFRQTSQYRWCENTRYGRGMGNPWNPYAVIYDRNLREVLADTQWRYSALRQYATRHDGAYTDAHSYLINYPKHPCIEYLVKLKLYSLAGSLICYGSVNGLNEKGKNVTEILNVKKEYIKIMQELNIGGDLLGLVQEFSKRKIPLSAEYYRNNIECFQNAYDATRAISYSKYASMEQIVNYCRKLIDKSRNFTNNFHTWLDYIRFAEQLPEYDLTNDFVVFPKHLTKAHDLANRRLQARKKAERTKKLKKISKELAGYLTELQKKYGFEDGVYEIVAPSNLVEIIKEGQILRHCVGGYAERVAEKETIVLFVRVKADRTIPFYTMEIQNDDIRQCRGKCNCDMNTGVKKFVEKFKQKVLKAA